MSGTITSMSKEQLYKSRVFRSYGKKAIFYMSSYGFPWWVYIVPILNLWLRGYSVVVYDFDKSVIDNDDPNILPSTIYGVVDSMRRFSEKLNIVGGIGNSLGAYFLHNHALRNVIPAIVLNGGGSIADMIFQDRNNYFLDIKSRYLAKNISKQKLDLLWKDIDDPNLSKTTKATLVVMYRSVSDNTIPKSSTDKFIENYKQSKCSFSLFEDDRNHIKSVYLNSFGVKRMLNHMKLQ